MTIRGFFHKIRIGFTRICETAIPYTSEAKRYGNAGEKDFARLLQRYLPTCRIKKNIIIQNSDGKAEIDCLVLYKNKLFAIEVKHWKGNLSEYENGIVQKKIDRWTDEVHTKYHKSPFKQLNRAIYLLRRQIPDKAWVNSIVYFEGTDFISVGNDTVWFDDMHSLVDYIVNSGIGSYGESADAFFQKCISADLIYSNRWDKSLHCIIFDETLCLKTNRGVLRRKDIREISIAHHWSYDELHIETTNGETAYLELENAKIIVIDNGYRCSYALCKIDWIKLGD